MKKKALVLFLLVLVALSMTPAISNDANAGPWCDLAARAGFHSVGLNGLCFTEIMVEIWSHTFGNGPPEGFYQ